MLIIGLSLAWQMPLHAQVWNQIGDDIDGEAAGDWTGRSVSMPDANTVAIGAPYNDGGGTNAGSVRIFQWNGSAWIQKGNDIDGEAVGDYAGIAVSMPDANTVAVGALYNDGGGANAGHVRIYQWNGSAWVQKGSDIDGEAAGDQAGVSVSMPDANTIAVGAYLNDGNGIDAGHVRIFQWDGSAWVQKGSDIDGEAAGDRAGVSVSMPDANTVAIGAYFNDGNGMNSGHVRIYQWNGSAWVQKGSDIDGENAADYAGVAVTMPDANTVAIGAPNNDGSGTDAGHVRIYQWNGSAWVQKGSDIDGEATGDQAGISVNMPDVNTVAVGAYLNDGNGINAGQVRIFQWNGSAWVQKGGDIDGEDAGDKAGVSVSMPDANTIAVGAYLNDGGGSAAGHARIFSCNTFSTVSPDLCNKSYTSPSGKYTWDTSGTYYDTLTNTGGCHTIITIHLSITTIDTTVTINGTTLMAGQNGATYQWLDCANSYAPIAGATNQWFVPTTSGSYAVAITRGSCSDTSDCHTVVMAGVGDASETLRLNIQPNPSDGRFILTAKEKGKLSYTVRDITGKILHRGAITTPRLTLDLRDRPAGLYIFEVTSPRKGTRAFRLMKR